MNTNLQDAINELNGNLECFVKNNAAELNEIKAKIMKKEKENDALPLSKKLGGDAYEKSDFSDFIRSGTDAFLKKSLNEKIGKDGGYLVPGPIAMQIRDRLKYLSPMRSIAKTINISTNSIDLLLDSKMPDAGWVAADGDQRDETASPEINKIKIHAHEIYAKPKASQRLLDDAELDVEEWLINRIAEKIAALENAAFVTGDGVDKPKGFLNYESEESPVRDFGKLRHFLTGSNGNFSDGSGAMDVLVDVLASLKPVYVKNAKWIMSRSAFGEIRKLKNSDGVGLWQPALSASTPATLLGYPVVIDDDMPQLELGKVSVSVAFGDFSAGYQIVDRQDLRILRDPYTSKPFVEFYASKRTGGAVVDFDAIKLLKFSER
ncbi:MAG: phage major capsid protein [Holosporaceae bacterium]|jgi:HK97 family phage major capsid protein|nr:phage major capsid protein [Holosporaceae bacterium]